MKQGVKHWSGVTVATGLVLLMAGAACNSAYTETQIPVTPQFSVASFCGRYVISYTGIYISATDPVTGLSTNSSAPLSALEAAVITADGKGNIVGGEFIQNAPTNTPQACSINSGQTYTVDSSPLGETGYLSMTPTYTCTGYDACPNGNCTILSKPYGSLAIQWACYLSAFDADKVVCTELGNTFTNNSFSARAVTWERTSRHGCP